MEIINSISNQHLIISIVLLMACLYIKKETGQIEKWKLQYTNPKLFPYVKFFADFSIDVIPIVGYHLISLISNNTGKTLFCTLLMIFVIYLESKFRNVALSLSDKDASSLSDKSDNNSTILKVFGYVILLNGMTIGLYLLIYFIANTDLLH